MSQTLSKILLGVALGLAVPACAGDESMLESDSSKADEKVTTYVVESEYAYLDITLNSDRAGFFTVLETESVELCLGSEIIGDGDSNITTTVLAWKGTFLIESASLALTDMDIQERPIEGCTEDESEDMLSEADLEACGSVKGALAALQARSSACTSG
jgi:hypothetical protein